LNIASQGGLFTAMRSNPTGANLVIIAIRLKSLAGGLFSSKGKRKSKIDRIKAELTTDRDNPQLWESLAVHCAMNREYYRESIDALSRAEAIYRDRGDSLKADELVRAIASFKSKI
jgi:hypothetical protein